MVGNFRIGFSNGWKLSDRFFQWLENVQISLLTRSWSAGFEKMNPLNKADSSQKRILIKTLALLIAILRVGFPFIHHKPLFLFTLMQVNILLRKWD